MIADYVIVGGFLGAGKTTALLSLAGRYTAAGRRVGLITNDQSQGLVDTSMARAGGYPVEEVTGGCFCCRFGSLAEAAARLTRDVRPDVLLAEPVGSCTDIRATVQYPLRRLYGADFRVAPLSVLVDPLRAARILGLEAGRSFSPKVQYIYEKQLEEADIIVVNKTDVVGPEHRAALTAALQSRYPQATVVGISARTGANVDAWADMLNGAPASRHAMEVDYDVYAEGEALLGWVNATCRLTAPRAFDGNDLVREVADRVQRACAERRIEIAHLKMTMSPDVGSDIAVLNLVRTDGRAESIHRLASGLTDGEFLFNLRAEGAPETLHDLAMTAIEEACRVAGVVVHVESGERFRPGRPQPTHRLADL